MKWWAAVIGIFAGIFFVSIFLSSLTPSLSPTQPLCTLLAEQKILCNSSFLEQCLARCRADSTYCDFTKPAQSGFEDAFCPSQTYFSGAVGCEAGCMNFAQVCSEAFDSSLAEARCLSS